MVMVIVDDDDKSDDDGDWVFNRVSAMRLTNSCKSGSPRTNVNDKLVLYMQNSFSSVSRPREQH